MVRLAERDETARRFLRIGPGVDGLFFLVAIRFVVVVARFFALQRHHLRVLRLRDLVGRVRIDEADDHVDETHLTGLDRLIVSQQQIIGAGIAAERNLDRLETLLDALRDAYFAFARQQLDGAHFAHIHAHGIGRATELRVQIGERGRGLFDGFFVGRGSRVGQQQRFRIRCFFIDRDAHVVDHVDDVFDLFRIDDLAGQMIVDFSVGEVSLLLAARDQQLQL